MVGRTSKTREGTQTVGLHGQHQSLDKNITVRMSCRRQQSLEGNRLSSDDGQLSNMICRNEKDAAHTFFQTLLYFLAVFFYVTINMSCAGQCNPLPTHVVVKNMFCSGGPLGRGPPARAPSAPWLIRHLKWE